MIQDQAYLALYVGPAEGLRPTITHNVIKAVTKSKYSHCEIAINGIGYSSSERDGGVRAKEIDFNSGKWEIVDLPWVEPAKVLSLYEWTQDDGYDFWGLRLFLNIPDPTDAPDLWWCSEWCAAAIGLIDTRISPEQLAVTVRRMLHSYRMNKAFEESILAGTERVRNGEF